MILDIAKSVEVVIATVTTYPLSYVAEFSDQTPQGVLAAQIIADGSLVVGTTTVVHNPSTQYVRSVSSLGIYNGDVAAQVVTVQINDNGTQRPYYKVTLQPGDLLTYQAGKGFTVVDANGNAKGIVPLPFLAAKDASVIQVDIDLYTSSRTGNTLALQQILTQPPSNGLVLLETPAFLIG